MTQHQAISEQHRAAERFRRAAWSAATNAVARALALLVILAGIRWTLPYLGPERLGIWMTIAGFVALLVFLDLGIANALTTRVATIAAKGSKSELSRSISGGLAYLALISLLAGGALYIASCILPWDILVKRNSPSSSQETRAAAQCFSLLYVAHLISTGIQKVFAGLQRSYEAHISIAVSSAFALLVLWFAARANASVPTLLLITLGIPTAGPLLLLAPLVRENLLQVQGLASTIKHEARALSGTAPHFFLLQLGTTVAWGADTLIISSTVGAAAVAAYSVTQRLFQLVIQPIGIANAPLWGAYADANARGDTAYIRNTLISSMRWTLCAAVIVALALILSGQTIIQLWTASEAIHVSVSLIISWAAWAIMDCAGNAWSVFMSGNGLTKPQAAAAMLFCCTAIPLKIVLIQHFGVSGLVWGTVACYGICVFGLHATFYRSEIATSIRK